MRDGEDNRLERVGLRVRRRKQAGVLTGRVCFLWSLE